MKRQFTMRLDDDQYRQWKAVAEHLGLSMAESVIVVMKREHTRIGCKFWVGSGRNGPICGEPARRVWVHEERGSTEYLMCDEHAKDETVLHQPGHWRK
jgi:hypothetical protein